MTRYRCPHCGHDWHGKPVAERATTGNAKCASCKKRGAKPIDQMENNDADLQDTGRTRWVWGADTDSRSRDTMTETDDDPADECEHEHTTPLPAGVTFETDDDRTGVTEQGDKRCADCDAVIEASGEVHQ